MRPTALRPNPGNRYTEQPRQWPGGLWALLSLSGPSGPTAMFQTASWGPAVLLEDTSSGCPCGTQSPWKPLLGWCQPVWSRPWVSIPAHSVLALTGRSHCPDGKCQWPRVPLLGPEGGIDLLECIKCRIKFSLGSVQTLMGLGRTVGRKGEMCDGQGGC